MNKENNNIDQLFSDAAQSEKAPNYDKAYWNEMNSILNARDTKKKAFLLWAVGGAAAFAVLLFSLFALNNDDAFTKQRYVSEKLNIEFEKTEFRSAELVSKSTIQDKSLKVNKLDNSQISSAPLVNLKNASASKVLNNNFKSKDFTSLNLAQTNNTELGLNNESLALQKDENALSSSTDSVNERNEFNNLDDSNKSRIGLPYTSSYNLKESKKINMIQSELKFKTPVKYTMYGKFSGGLMENYKTSRPLESGLFDFSFNLEINMNHVLLRTGIGSQITTNADLIVSQRKTINGTTVINLQKDLSYQNLYDIYIPLEFGYELNKTSFGVGAQVNYLQSTSMDLNNYENKMLVNTEKQYGNKDGLNSFSTQGYIWIEQRFTPMLSLGLKTGTNISGRIKDGDYFNESSTTNPIYGQLSLRLNLCN